MLPACTADAGLLMVVMVMLYEDRTIQTRAAVLALAHQYHARTSDPAPHQRSFHVSTQQQQPAGPADRC